MDKKYIVGRLRSDLRDEMYDLMSYPAYHTLEKELTDSILLAHPLFSGLHRFSYDSSISAGEKEEKKQLFAFIIYLEMNQRVGGFHFDRYKRLSTGPAQEALLAELIDRIDFDDFLRNCVSYSSYLEMEEFHDFAESRQFRFLEDTITSVIKKNKVIPAVGTAMALDIINLLHLSEDYGYVKPTPEMKEDRFIFPFEKLGKYVVFQKATVLIEARIHTVLLRRVEQTSNEFRYLLTDFGAMIEGKKPQLL